MCRLGANQTGRNVVNTLPAELLSEVFLYVASSCLEEAAELGPKGDNFDYFDSFATGLRHYDWLPITEVCRYWREVAISCSGLWISLNAAWENWQTILQRSKVADNLRVIGRGVCSSWCGGLQCFGGMIASQATDTILEQMSRICSLKMVLSPCYFHGRDSTDFLTSATPKLTRLELLARSQVDDMIWLPDRVDIFGRVPALQSLTVYQISMAWTYLGMTQLVHLELITTKFNELSGFLSLLNASPNLKTLILVDIVYEVDDGPLGDPLGYSLDSLRHLTIMANANFVDDLCFHLIVPDTLSWDLAVTSMSETVTDSVGDFSALSRDYNWLLIDVDLVEDGVVVKLRAKGYPDGSVITRKTYLNWKNRLPMELDVVLEAFIGIDQLARADSLCVDIHERANSLSMHDWIIALLHFKRLHILQLRGCPEGPRVRPLLKALSIVTTRHRSEGPSRPCSAVRTLFLDSIDFSSRRSHAWKHLCSFIRNLPEPLITLDFEKGCRGLSRTKVHELRKLGKSIYWADDLSNYLDDDDSDDCLGSGDESSAYPSDLEAGKDNSRQSAKWQTRLTDFYMMKGDLRSRLQCVHLSDISALA